MRMPKPMGHKFRVALENRGHKIVRHGKYTVMDTDRSLDDKPIFLYIGSSGALRRGTSQATSRPCNEEFKKRLIEEYETLKDNGELDRSGELKT